MISFMYIVPPVCDTFKFSKIISAFLFLLSLLMNITVVLYIKREKGFLNCLYPGLLTPLAKLCEGRFQICLLLFYPFL